MIYLQHLRLHQFRCHAKAEWDFSPGVTVFLGKNGRGKTSVLEAIYLLSRLRSFRTVHLPEMAQWGTEVFRTEAKVLFSDQKESETLSFTWKKGERILEKNQNAIRDPKEFWGRIPTVLFTPEDQNLIVGGASLRRQWIDHLLGQQFPSYVELSQRYQRVLKQRNAWLKEEHPRRELGEIYQQQLEPLAEEITNERQKETDRLMSCLQTMAERLGFPAEQRLSIHYQPRWQGKSNWEELWERERRLQTTLVGPHRDEWDFRMGERSIADFGSQGQQRLFALALRFLEAQHLYETRKYWPLFLIDDVTHSLDDERRARFHEILPQDAQRFVTLPSARPQDIPPGASLIRWEIERGPSDLNQE